MKRREFIALVGGATAGWSLNARAQQADRIRRIGVLYLLSDPTAPRHVAAFQQGLQALGWTEGYNIRIAYGDASTGLEGLKSVVQQMIHAAPEVIVIVGNPAVNALRNVDHLTPGVFLSVGDPVGSGFVESLSRPGGNLTGFATFEAEMGGKWLELLKEAAPTITRATVLLQPDIAANVEYHRVAAAAGASLKVEVQAAGVRDAAEIERWFAREPNSGLIVLPNPVSFSNRELISKLSIVHRLPSIFAFRMYVESGGLMCYGFDVFDLWRRTAGYVDRILRGEKPADLPVQLPTKFELVINLTTAKTIGLEVPPQLLARADEVIE